MSPSDIATFAVVILLCICSIQPPPKKEYNIRDTQFMLFGLIILWYNVRFIAAALA